MVTDPWSTDAEPPPAQTQHKWRRLFMRHLTKLSIVLMVMLLAGIVLYPYMVINVPSGHVGLLWKRFRGGTVLDPRQLSDEGLRIIFPWNKMFLYDLRLQSVTEAYNAISKDGVNLTAAINIRFRLKQRSIPHLHQVIGPNYIALLVGPEIGNRTREVIAEYTAEEVYSTKRQEIQDKIRGRTETMLGGGKVVERTAEQSEYGDHYSIAFYEMLNLIDTLLLGIELPPAVVTAINRKIEQYYISEEYTFRVAREVRESERKKIEAEGIREFQTIVSQGISDSYLRWRGIEATLQLAQSSNAKVVIVGGGKDGLPIILGNVDGPPLQPAPPTEGGAMLKERPTAARPATPSEKVPAVGLSTPAERMPAAAEKEVPRSVFPFPLNWSEIEAIFSRLSGLRPPGPEAVSPPRPPSERLAAQPPR
jgi:regulator of protease activity HflC (stomatin/prohibitin superfamily)